MTLVLKELLANPNEPSWGFLIGKKLGLPRSTTYPLLARLEKNGWLSGELEDIDQRKAGRRARRYYRLTDLGLREARKHVDRLLGSLGEAGEISSVREVANSDIKRRKWDAKPKSQLGAVCEEDCL